MDAVRMITASEVRELLSYDPETGSWKWLVRRSNSVPAGSEAGYVGVLGYRVIGIGGKLHKSSRLAWLYMTGEWPVGQIDHRDCDKSNDRWENLREATRSQNGSNARAQRNNRHKMKGIALGGRKKHRWLARIMKDGKRIHLGYFATAEEAHAAYAIAAKNLFGEFARAA